MLIWAMLDCRYKLDHIRIDRSKREGLLKHNPGDWIGTSRQLDEASIVWTFRREIHNSKQGRIQSTRLVFQAIRLGRNSRITRPQESSRLSWIQTTKLGPDLEIQSIGLVFQVTGLGSNSKSRDPVNWMVFQATGFARIQFNEGPFMF